MDYIAKKVGLFYFSTFINVHIIMDWCMSVLNLTLERYPIGALSKFCFIYL